ncbi:hypothetical protein D3C85_1128200 [compost metagenome]
MLLSTRSFVEPFHHAFADRSAQLLEHLVHRLRGERIAIPGRQQEPMPLAVDSRIAEIALVDHRKALGDRDLPVRLPGLDAGAGRAIVLVVGRGDVQPVDVLSLYRVEVSLQGADRQKQQFASAQTTEQQQIKNQPVPKLETRCPERVAVRAGRAHI